MTTTPRWPRRLTRFWLFNLFVGTLISASSLLAQPTLTMRNSGQSVIGTLPLPSQSVSNQRDNFAALTDQDGNIVFFFNVDQWWGFIMGRYNIATHQWELWSPNGWSTSASAVPQPLGEGFFETSYTRYNEPNYFFGRSPLSGELFAVVSGMPKIGKHDFDVHGNPFHFLFDGQRWLSYASNAFNERLRAPVISNWGHSSRFTFAPNDSGQGIMITNGATMSAPAYYYAARLDYQRGAPNNNNYWTQWRDNAGTLSWNTSGTQTPILSGQGGGMSYLMLSTYAGHDGFGDDTYLFYEYGRSYKYTEFPAMWWIWGPSGWELDTGQSSTAPVGNPIIQGNGYELGDRLVRVGSEVLLLSQAYTRNASQLVVGTTFTYSKATGATLDWATSSQSIPGVEPYIFSGSATYKTFVPVLTASGDLAVLYLTSNLSSGQTEIREIRYNGSWGAPSDPLYTFTPSQGEQIRLLSAVLTRPQDGEDPVIFLKRNNNYYCLGNGDSPIWDGEQALFPTDGPPAAQSIDTTRFSHEVSFANDNPNPPSSFYEAQSSWFLALDQDGYLYAPQTGFCSVVIHPPGANNYNLSKHWGDFWDVTMFPGAIAVDHPRSMIYFLDYLDTGGGGGYSQGRLRWLGLLHRDSFIDTRIGGDGGPSYPFPENGGVIPSLFTPASLATGMVIDESSGILYLASALHGTVLKYDLINRDAQNRPVYVGQFISGLSGPVGMIRDEEGDFYIAESTSHRVSRFSPQGAYLDSFGTLGRNQAQFCYPTQLAYSKDYQLLYVLDSMNNRLQVFDKSGEPISTWGRWQENLAEQNFQFLSGITADVDKLYVSTGRTYSSGNIKRFRINDTPPTTGVILDPAPNQELSGVVTVQIEGADDWGFIGADLLVNGESVVTKKFNATRELSTELLWDTRLTGQCATVSIQALLIDVAGHTLLTPAQDAHIRNGSCTSASSNSSSSLLSSSNSQQSSSTVSSASSQDSRSSQASDQQIHSELHYHGRTLEVTVTIPQSVTGPCRASLFAAENKKGLAGSAKPLAKAGVPSLPANVKFKARHRARADSKERSPLKIKTFFRTQVICQDLQYRKDETVSVKVPKSRSSASHLKREWIQEIARRIKTKVF